MAWAFSGPQTPNQFVIDLMIDLLTHIRETGADDGVEYRDPYHYKGWTYNLGDKAKL